MEKDVDKPRRKRRFVSRKKRTLDPNLIIDYKYPDILKRFITDRGKIIPRRISGATAKQQRQIALAVKRARFLGLLHYSVSHVTEKGFTGDMTSATAFMGGRDFSGGRRFERDYNSRGSQESSAPASSTGAGSEEE